MSWKKNINRVLGAPVGISFKNGGGTSGVLCDVRYNTLYVMEYLYKNQFATKQYDFSVVSDVNPFPMCKKQPWPRLH